MDLIGMTPRCPQGRFVEREAEHGGDEAVEPDAERRQRVVEKNELEKLRRAARMTPRASAALPAAPTPAPIPNGTARPTSSAPSAGTFSSPWNVGRIRRRTGDSSRSIRSSSRTSSSTREALKYSRLYTSRMRPRASSR